MLQRAFAVVLNNMCKIKAKLILKMVILLHITNKTIALQAKCPSFV